MNEYQKHGYGLLMMDNSSVIFSKWNNNVVNGPYAFINDKITAFGTLNAGQLDGYNVIVSLVEPYKSVSGMFRNDKPYGNVVLTMNDDVMVGRFVNGELVEIAERADRYNYLEEFLDRMFKDNCHHL